MNTVGIQEEDLPQQRLSFQRKAEETDVMRSAKGVNTDVNTGPFFSIAHTCMQYVTPVTITPCKAPTYRIIDSLKFVHEQTWNTKQLYFMTNIKTCVREPERNLFLDNKR